MEQFIKLSSLVDQQFTITKVGGYQWKSWSPTENKMLTSPTYVQGYQKKYSIETDKGKLDVSSSQLASMLEAVQYEGVADVNGKAFNLKSNGKTGMEIRYFFNAAKSPSVGLDMGLREELAAKAKPKDVVVDNLDDEINLDNIPF